MKQINVIVICIGCLVFVVSACAPDRFEVDGEAELMKRNLHVFISDLGTRSIKSSEIESDGCHFKEVTFFDNPGSASYMFIDDDPELLFWFGEYYGHIGARMLITSDLQGNNKDSLKLEKNVTRICIDPYSNAFIYEFIKDGKYQLLTAPYDQSGSVEINHSVLLHESDWSHSSLHVAANPSGKIYWLKRTMADKGSITGADLLECDPKVDPPSIKEVLRGVENNWLKDVNRFVIDTRDSFMYWTQLGSGVDEDMIRRYPLNEKYAEPQDWIQNPSNAAILCNYPADLKIDFVDRKLYWVDINENWLVSVDMDKDTIHADDLDIIVQFPSDQGYKLVHKCKQCKTCLSCNEYNDYGIVSDSLNCKKFICQACLNHDQYRVFHPTSLALIRLKSHGKPQTNTGCTSTIRHYNPRYHEANLTQNFIFPRDTIFDGVFRYAHE